MLPSLAGEYARGRGGDSETESLAGEYARRRGGDSVIQKPMFEEIRFEGAILVWFSHLKSDCDENNE
jgi:hypothetical protein